MAQNVHAGHRERVRRRFIRDGSFASFEDHQILELLLFYSVPVQDTNDLAHKLINAFGSLYNLFEANPVEIARRTNVQESTAVLISMVPHLTNRYFTARWETGMVFRSAEDVGHYAMSIYAGITVETVFLLCLDSAHKLKNKVLISEGSVTHVHLDPNKIAAAAVVEQTPCVIITHNHPGGTLKPSQADIRATRETIIALEAVKVELLDHIIVCGNKFLSMSKAKYISTNCY